MRKIQLLILLGMFMGSSQMLRSQVFAYPGATWVFHSPPFLGFCSQIYEKWEYVNDTTVLGYPVKNIKVGSTSNPAWDTTIFIHGTYHKFFQVNGDVVSYLNLSDSTFQEIYNFSLGIGDTTLSPIGNLMNPVAATCPDSIPYKVPALVVDTGHTIIAGQSLRYYTVKYQTGTDTAHAFETYYERIITLGAWYPADGYNCGATDPCNPPGLICYKDMGMVYDSLCTDLTWFETLSVEEEAVESSVKIYPNPAIDILMITSNDLIPGKYAIFTADGKCVAIGLQSPLNVALLSPGIYFVTNENHTWYKKFIKD